LFWLEQACAEKNKLVHAGISLREAKQAYFVPHNLIPARTSLFISHKLARRETSLFQTA
jgi:hypothetical protein